MNRHPFLRALDEYTDETLEDIQLEIGNLDECKSLQDHANCHLYMLQEQNPLVTQFWPVLMFEKKNMDAFKHMLLYLQQIYRNSKDIPDQFILAEAGAEYAETLHRQNGSSEKQLVRDRYAVYQRLLRPNVENLPNGSFEDVLQAYQDITRAIPQEKSLDIQQDPVEEPPVEEPPKTNIYKGLTIPELQKLLRQKANAVSKGEDVYAPHLLIAELIWREVETQYTLNPFVVSSDTEKMNHFRKLWPEFLNTFPIVSKYMILLREYDFLCFRQMLVKMQSMIPKTMEERQKSNPRERWCEIRADYVASLYKAKSRHHNRKEIQKIRSQVLETIRKEFLSFEKEYTSTEEEVKNDEKLYQKELLMDMMSVVHEQLISDDFLLELEVLANKQSFGEALQALRENTKLVPAKCSGFGKNSESNYEMEMKMHGKGSRYSKVALH